ncbi:MAG TPA: hypothetical protein VJY35_04075 [Candidatus Eisenbacteria bacterium]|nr:hypothetical protein [Candidatus Eisenbacteria bacterium]
MSEAITSPPRRKSFAITLVGALSLLLGVLSIVGSATMVSDGLGMTRIGTATSAPEIGTTSAPPPEMAGRVVAFGVARGLLSILLVIGAVGTLFLRPYGRACSLAYAIGWIIVGGLEPWALRYQFGWPVVVAALYPFLLMAMFNRRSWKAAFAGTGPA